MKEITFVTSNENKVKEIKKLLKNTKVNQENIDYPEIQDEIKEVAKHGAKWCYQKIKKPLIVEDSGLFIKEFKGFPGPFSSYVFEKIGNDGIINLLNNKVNRKAYFLSIIGFIKQNKIKLFKGKTEGKITKEKSGNKGFGYDPIFSPKNAEKTFGEMDTVEKN